MSEPRDERDPLVEGLCNEQPPLPNSGQTLDWVAWCHTPPSPDTPTYIPIISPRLHGGALKGYVLSKHAVAVHTHWMGDRTVPCLSLGRVCQGCRNEAPRRLRGYMGVLLYPVDRICTLELTTEVLRRNPWLMTGERDLRAMTFECWREGRSVTGRVHLKMGTPTEEAKRAVDKLICDTPYDVRESLARVWGLRLPDPK